MHRIDGAGADVTGRWTEGNPSTGVPATEITADWMNAVQSEIENVIVTGAGAALSKPNNAQLLAAILTVVARNLTPESFTVSGLPSAASNARRVVYVSNESGGAVLAFSDGISWRRVTDRAVVS
jgi:hypothetical protein